MTTHQPPSLGACPNCDSDITRLDVLIEYETEDGDRAVWAECPACTEVVDPE